MPYKRDFFAIVCVARRDPLLARMLAELDLLNPEATKLVERYAGCFEELGPELTAPPPDIDLTMDADA